MITASQWRPDGGYNYYEIADQIAPIGDDLPNPVMPAPTKLGVPSLEVGQPLPAGATLIGEGAVPVGIITPMDTSFVGRLLPFRGSPAVWFVAGAVAIGAVWLVLHHKGRA